MQKLINFADKAIREELGDYYIVSKDRMDNILHNFDVGAKRIKELSDMLAVQQTEIAELSKIIFKGKSEQS